MTDVTFEILAVTDDGYCGTDGINFYNTLPTYNPFGRSTTRPYRSWYRFDNITIPPESFIVSAILRVTSDNTVNWNDIYNNVYLEAADDPDAPTDWADLNSRPLGSAVAWDHTGYWYEDSTYDSSDISSILQDVVDRAGWNSGQAVQIHLIDDGSASGRYKRIFTQSQDLQQSLEQSVKLIVTYSTPGDVVDSLVVDDDVDAFNLSDDLPESFGADDTVAAFNLSDDLPDSLTVDDDIDAIALTVDLPESFGVDDAADSVHERTMSPLQDSFGVSADIDAIDCTPDVPISFNISGLSDAFKVAEDVPDSFVVADIIGANRVREVIFADEFVLADEFDAFNYSAWLRLNLSISRLRFFCTITGSADLKDDVEIPIRSFYARKKSGAPSYLQVVVPGFEYAWEVAGRPNGDLILEIGYEVDGVVSLRERISIVDIDEISTYDGGANRSITVAGHRTITYGNNYIEIARSLATYHALQKNVLNYRFAKIDPYLNPGDTLVVGETAMTVKSVVYIVDSTRQTMHVSEAA